MSLLGMNVGPTPQSPTRIRIPAEGSVTISKAENGVVVRVCKSGPGIWSEDTYVYRNLSEFRLE